MASNGDADATFSNEPASYFLPRHNQEADRLNGQHKLFRATLRGQRYLSPLKSPASILDIGCGTAIWGMEMSDEFSEAQIVSMDIAPNKQPLQQPHNHRYIVADFEENWPFENSFDYIHARMIVIAMRNPRKVIQQAYQHLAPEGWFELQDLEVGPDGMVEENPSPHSLQSCDGMMGWARHMTEGSAKLGVDMAVAQKWPALLEEAGFVNVAHKIFKWPFGPWPEDEHLKDLGQLSLNNFLSGVAGFSAVVFTKGLGWSQKELEVFLEKLRKDLLTTDRRIYMRIHVICAQKPCRK